LLLRCDLARSAIGGLVVALCGAVFGYEPRFFAKPARPFDGVGGRASDGCVTAEVASHAR